MSRALLLFMLCPALLAQNQQPPDPSTLARIDGRVVNSATGEPLRKAELTLHGPQGGEQTVTSDASGHFALEKITPGTYNLTAQHQNFAVLGYGASRPGVPGKGFTLTAGQSLTAVEIKMVPFGVLTGKVVDQDGDPIAGVPILVMHWGFMRGGRQLMAAGGGASTNDRGEYRIYNLAAGRYYVSARPFRTDTYESPTENGGRRINLRKEPARESFAMTFYPSALDVSSASLVTLNPGQELPGLDIQLRRTRTYTVQGKVTGIERGHRYSLSIQPQDASSSGSFGMGRAAAVRPEDGVFTFRGIAPGRYNLLAMADNRLGARQELTIGDGDLDGLVIAVLDPGVVKGRVSMEASSGSKPPSLKGMRVSLTPVEAIQMNLPNASTGEDGTFTLEEVPADRYRVNCSPLAGTYLKAIRWGGQPSNDGVVEMPAGGSAALELVFAATTAQIEGDVKMSDDQPASASQVLLSPASRRESDFRMVLTDANGHFVAKGVAPGSYTALATDATIFTLPDAVLLKALEKVTTSVSVDENGRSTVSLKLVPESVIEAAQ